MKPSRQRIRRRGQRSSRRRFRERITRSLRLAATGLLAGAILGALGAGAYHLWDFTQNSDFFRLREIVIDGVTSEVEAEMQALMVDLIEGKHTLFSISPMMVRTRLTSHPRLEPGEIEVRRHWPDTLLVSAAERKPIATIAGPRLMLTDSDGWIMEQSPSAVLAAGLPLLTGLDPSDLIYGERISDPRAEQLLVWLAALRHHLPSTHRALSELHIDHTGEVTAHLIGGAVIRVGDRGPREQIPVLLTFKREIEDDLTELALLNLRMDDHLVYRRRGVPTAVASTEIPAGG